MRIELTVSRIATKNKPDESLKPTIYNHFKKENISIEELFSFYNSSSSFTVSPAIYKKNHILDKNWESQEVVYIDFDGGMTYNEALQCCKNFNINPIIKYSRPLVFGFLGKKVTKKLQFSLRLFAKGRGLLLW